MMIAISNLQKNSMLRALIADAYKQNREMALAADYFELTCNFVVILNILYCSAGT